MRRIRDRRQLPSLVFVVFAAVALLAACGESRPDLSPKTVAETDARTELVNFLKVTVPTDYEFKGAYAMPAGQVGTPDYYMRFDRPTPFDQPTPGLDVMAKELAAVNWSFRPFQDVDCAVRWLAGNTRLAKLGIPCAASTRMQISNDSDPEVAIKGFQTGRSLVLAADATSLSLYVIAIGS